MVFFHKIDEGIVERLDMDKEVETDKGTVQEDE
jgi:hypothetical protein